MDILEGTQTAFNDHIKFKPSNFVIPILVGDYQDSKNEEYLIKFRAQMKMDIYQNDYIEEIWKEQKLINLSQKYL